METQVATGTWSAYSTQLSVEEFEIFKKALDGLVGVKYTPFAVANQIVAGMNYRFLCNAMGVYPGATNELALVQIYKPLDGQAHITSIKRCD